MLSGVPISQQGRSLLRPPAMWPTLLRPWCHHFSDVFDLCASYLRLYLEPLLYGCMGLATMRLTMGLPYPLNALLLCFVGVKSSLWLPAVILIAPPTSLFALHQMVWCLRIVHAFMHISHAFWG